MPQNVLAKIFRQRQGKSLTINLIDRRAGPKKTFQLTIDLARHDLAGAGQATLYELGGTSSRLPSRQEKRTLTIEVPPLTGEAAAIVIEL
jgi:hypothetical protein